MSFFKNTVKFFDSLKESEPKKLTKSNFQTSFEEWLGTTPGSQSENCCIERLKRIYIDSEEALEDMFMAYIRTPKNSPLKEILEKRLGHTNVTREHWMELVEKSKFMPQIVRKR